MRRILVSLPLTLAYGTVYIDAIINIICSISMDMFLKWPSISQ